MKIIRTYSWFLFLIWHLSVNGQLATTPGTPAPALVQNVLLGPGVTVSNITYNGSPSAISEFSYAGPNLGISSGIVMTTGTTYNNGAGPHGPNNLANAGVDNGAAGSALLSNIIGGTQTFNATILEFDFIPYSDTVRFRYIFGSEEYPEFAPPNNSSYNDVFGFFISGPGIAGTQNIARLPSGSIVSINNVNQITNSTYYNDNGDGNTAPYNSSPLYIQYDGFTDVLTASSKVECGETYHLILAIADVGDGIYDSGIFLEANSLSSNTSSALTIPINVSGTATEGVDYTDIPASVTIPPGQTTVTLTLDAFADALTESEETLSISFQITDACGNVNPITVDLSIGDVQPVAVSVESGDVVCPGDDVELMAVASGGVGPYTYSWNTGASTSSIFVTPTSTQTYTVSVTDNCLNQTATGSGTVNVPVYPPIVINESADITEICPYLPSQLETSVTGGAGNYSYAWTDESGANLGNQSTQIVTPSETTTYTITVTDQCGLTSTATVIYTITSPPLLTSITPDIEICPGDSVLLTVNASGGYGQYFFLWPQTGETSSSIWVYPLESTTYTVNVSDECQTFVVTDQTTVFVVRPNADFVITSSTLFDNLPITFQNLTTNGETYSWEFGDGNSSTVVHPNNIYAEPGTYIVTLIATDEKGCMDTIAKPITIEEGYYVYIPNTFTPDGFRFNNVFEASTVGVQTLNVKIFNRWGELVFESEERDFQWDGTYRGAPVQDGTYIWKIRYFTNSGREILTTGHINCIR
ncbi:MAG: choice-of-anchor L domain-containing protein [Cryomorphaceae bacterium]|nr:choice-of-anchor L domain-containing protein [Cryomorphaceae bacterium]